MRRTLGYNPLTRVTTYHHFDHSTGKSTIELETDAEAIVDANKRDQCDRPRTNEWLNHRARIDPVTYSKWLHEGLGEGIPPYGDAHKQFIKRKLDDLDNCYFRTWRGRHPYFSGYRKPHKVKLIT